MTAAYLWHRVDRQFVSVRRRKVSESGWRPQGRIGGFARVHEGEQVVPGRATEAPFAAEAAEAQAKPLVAGSLVAGSLAAGLASMVVL